MDTNPNLAVGTTQVPTPSSSHHTVHGLSVGGHDLRHLLIYKAFIKSGLSEPFRILLKPLKQWVLKHHVAIHASQGAAEMVDLSLKKPSIVTVVLTVVLAPLIFVMLLPLLLILVPMALVIGFVAALIAAFQVDGPPLTKPAT